MARPPKKSEIIEIRVSHETKEAMKARARREGRSLSAVLRQLIDDYLAAESRDTSVQRFRETLMSIFARLKTRPRLALAALSSLLVMGAALVSLPARAQEITLGVRAEIARSDEAAITRQVHETTLATSFGETVSLDLGPRDAPTHRMVLTASELEDGTLRLEITLYDGTGPDAPILAKPVMTFEAGSDVSMRIGAEDETGALTDGVSLQFSVAEAQ